jgi:hypothetical protein
MKQEEGFSEVGLCNCGHWVAGNKAYDILKNGEWSETICKDCLDKRNKEANKENKKVLDNFFNKMW